MTEDNVNAVSADELDAIGFFGSEQDELENEASAAQRALDGLDE